MTVLGDDVWLTVLRITTKWSSYSQNWGAPPPITRGSCSHSWRVTFVVKPIEMASLGCNSGNYRLWPGHQLRGSLLCEGTPFMFHDNFMLIEIFSVLECFLIEFWSFWCMISNKQYWIQLWIINWLDLEELRSENSFHRSTYNNNDGKNFKKEVLVNPLKQIPKQFKLNHQINTIDQRENRGLFSEIL